jgi:CubicO group peptidase (beta-lactamase class C family)
VGHVGGNGRRALLVLGVSAVVACAGPEGAAPIYDFGRADSTVADWVQSERIPGGVLLVARGGRVLHERAWGTTKAYDYGSGQYPGAEGGGLVRLDAPAPMSSDAIFDLASVTKVMATTMAVMILVDRGQLDLDAPVATYLPDFALGERSEITPHHLLTHRSGLPQWVPVYYHAGDPEQAYAYIRDLSLAWPVGEARHYSDLGFMVLGRVVEAVSGTTLDVFLERELYGPLGLLDTGFRPRGGPYAGGRVESRRYASTSHGNPYERRMVHDSTFGYRIPGDPETWNGWREYTLTGEVNDGNAYHAFGGVAGHAGLFSTARELGTLLQLLLDHGRSEDVQLVSEKTVTRFLTSTGDDQALGWQLPAYAPHGAFGHSGFTGTFVLGVPEHEVALVLLTNRQNVGVDAETRYPDVGPLQREVTAAVMDAVATDSPPP